MPNSQDAASSHLKTVESRPPPIPAIDVVAVLDPASTGGGGPLVRITTQQKEREEKERARRLSIESGLSQKESSGGLLKRFRSSPAQSTSRPLEPVTAGTEYDAQPTEGNGNTRSIAPEDDGSGQTNAGLPKSEVYSEDEKRRDIEAQLPSLRNEVTAGQEKEEEEYVYPDGGYGWVVVASCATLAALAMGWTTTWGLLFDYLSRNDYRDSNQTLLSTIGPFSAFFGHGSAFFFGRLGDKYGFKIVLYSSTFTIWFATFISAFTTQLWQLVLSYGVLLGIGQGMAIPLFMSLPSQWFYKRRGMASGMAIGGAGLGGGIAVQIMQPLLINLGFKKTLITMSFMNLFFFGLAVFLLKTRPTSPEARKAGRGPWIDKVVVRRSTFWSIAISLLVAVSAYGIPWNYVPLWCSTYLPNLTPQEKTVPPTILCFALVAGRFVVGLTADYIGPVNTYILVFFLSGVSNFALWLTASTFGGIIGFVVIYGLIAPGYIGLLPQIVVQLFGPDNLATNVGLILLFNCPGNFIAGPLGSVLFEMTGRTTFRWVCIVGGCLQFAGAAVACWSRFKTDRRLFAKV